MTDLEVVEAVYETFKRGKWIAGSLVSPSGSMCLVGAVHCFANGDVGVRSARSKHVLAALGFAGEADAMSFNDSYGYQAVLRLLKGYIDSNQFDAVLRARAKKYPARITVTRNEQPLLVPSEWERNKEVMPDKELVTA